MKLRNAALTAMAATMVLTMVQGTGIIDYDTSHVAEASSITQHFKDVNTNSVPSIAINALYENGYIQHGDGTFKPDQPMTVQHFTYLLSNTGIQFPKMYNMQVVVEGGPSNLYFQQIGDAVNAGLVPYKEGTLLESSRNVTQQDLAYALVNGFGLSGTGTSLEGTLEGFGIIPSGTFKAEKEITRADFATQLYKTLVAKGEIGSTTAQKATVATTKPTTNAKDMVGVRVASTTQPQAVASNSGYVVRNPFKDVAKTNPYYEIIHQMRDQKIISGYENGMFKPNENIQRKHGAALVSRAVELPSTTSYVAFKDVTTSNANHAAIKELQMAGIFKADSKGNFNPNVDMTRGEMAKVIATAFNLNVANTGNSSFKDVKANSEYSPYIEALAKANITTGYGDGTFKPTGSLSRAHFAVFMHRAMEFKETGSVAGSDALTPTPTPVPKPVETKPVDTKPTTPSKEVSSYPSDKVLTQDMNVLDFVIPGNKSHMDKLNEQREKANVIRLEQPPTNVAALSMVSKLTSLPPVAERASEIAAKLGLSSAEVTQLINYAYGTGEVYNGGNFYIYFNYTNNTVVYSYAP